MTTQAQILGLGEFVRWGFTLEHPDDHIVELRHQGEFVARFSQHYYEVVAGGGGLGWLKFPNHVHVGCIGKHLGGE